MKGINRITVMSKTKNATNKFKFQISKLNSLKINKQGLNTEVDTLKDKTWPNNIKIRTTEAATALTFGTPTILEKGLLENHKDQANLCDKTPIKLKFKTSRTSTRSLYQ